ncbi:MAG: PD-(D/E)XK nuclease family protein, partial [Coprobacillus sp.]
VHYNDILKVLSQDALRICFSYSLQTLSGETLIPSSLYKQIQYMFSLKEEPKAQFYAMDDFYQLGGESSDKPILNKNIHQYLNCKNQPEKLSKDITDSLYSSHLSVSQIETYNKCPFAYFIQYGLNIYPHRDNQLMPNELGSLVHYVLSICIDQDQDINQLVEDYIRQDDLLSVKIQSSSINLYFIEQLKKDLHITIQIARRQISLSHFRVLSKEEKITDEIKGINFKGFVDRIDQCEEKISIIDYKSSDKDIDLNLAMQGFNIQMLLYLKMVTRQYHKDPAAVLYFNTKKRVLSLKQSLKDDIDDNEFYKQYRYGGYVFDDDSHSSILALDPQMDKKSNIVNISYVKTKNEYKGHLLTPQQLNVLLKIIEDHIYELYTHIIDGDISISPKGSDQSATHTVVNPCRYCPYHSVCSFDVFYNDYQLVQFLDVDQMLGGDEDAI